MCKKRQIYLVGIGAGSREMLTVQAAEVIQSCDCLIGAERMIECAVEICGGSVAQTCAAERSQNQGMHDERECPADLEKKHATEDAPAQKEIFCEYRPVKIAEWLACHPKYQSAAILFSGDTGFYSGAKRMMQALDESSEADSYEMTVIPGIASVICLAARLGVSWEDAAIISLHGRTRSFIQTVNRNRKTFLLLGGDGVAAHFLNEMKEYDMTDAQIYAGIRLSYPDERICSGTVAELNEEMLSGLCVVFIENPSPVRQTGPHIDDESLIRGDVPMTKAEVRAVSIAKLELTEDAIVYDIGAGTGSVSVEAALSGDGIRVYAIEKNPEAVELLRRNRRKFRTDGIRIVSGMAPEVLEELEPPTHVFIGGSSGNLREILRTVRAKNPHVRIVINAIALETVQEVMEAVEEGLLEDAEIVQLTAARSRKIGRYHMMTGMNPIYIVSAGRESDS